MPDYKAAFEAASSDLSAIMSLLGFTSYPGIDPMLRAITNLTLAKAQEQVLRQHKTDYMEAAEGTKRALEAEAQALREEVVRLKSEAEYAAAGFKAAKDEVAALRARVVVDEHAEFERLFSIYKMKRHHHGTGGYTDFMTHCVFEAFQAGVRLNGKAVSEELLRRCEQMLQFYFEYLCDESAEEVDITMAAEARDELRALLGEGKEAGDV